jgi:hypothetical protein
LGISIQIHIASLQPGDKDLYSKLMAYETVLYEDQKTKAILDIPLEGQEGITQREMEALFFRKKLITTNPLVKERDYYCSDNIYIIDFSQPSNDIVTFLQKPYIPVSEDIISSYSIDSWLQRFLVK